MASQQSHVQVKEQPDTGQDTLSCATSAQKNPVPNAPKTRDDVQAPLDKSNVRIEVYKDERQLKLMQPLIDRDLSEPYTIFTYRYFIRQWPDLCYLAMEDDNCIGAVVCKLEMSKRGIYRGYIAMLAVREDRRKLGLGSKLVAASIHAMVAKKCQEVALEAEVTNRAALKLYQNLGFIRDKRLEKYYLNGNDAFRLKLRLQSFPPEAYMKY